MPAGRPSKYNQSYVDAVYDYLEKYEELGDIVPSIEGLACHINLAVSTIHKWSGEEGKEKFSEALGKLMAHQGRKCLNKGLDGTFNPAITKLLLHNHGYSDKAENKTDLTSGGEKIGSILQTLQPVEKDTLPEDKTFDTIDDS